MKGKKTSSDKKAKVIEAKISNPDLSLRDIEKETGVKKDAAGDIIKKDLPEVATSSDTIAKLIDDNNEIMNLTGGLVMQKLKEGEKVHIGDIMKARDLAFRQNELTKAIEGSDKEVVVKFEL